MTNRMRRSDVGMPPPTNRKQFEHNINLVVEDLHKAIDNNDEEGIANKYWITIPHLKKVAFLPNRRIDLSTVNEMIRSQANMMDWMQYMPLPKRMIDNEPKNNEHP